MINVATIKNAREQINNWKKQGLTIGLVPTMGFLHKGHISLIEKAKMENDRVVVSIFLNPIQFSPNEDYEKYPKDIKKDVQMCENAKTDMVFCPTVSEMYQTKNLAYINVNELSNNLCGAKRQGHFKGVCTVVAKLFNILTPNKAYFGQKDAQQLILIKKMAEDLNFNIEIVACPIVREKDGLAMSSRNSYLSKEQRQSAIILYKSLEKAKTLLESGQQNADIIIKEITKEINKEPLARIDYVEIVDQTNLQKVNEINMQVIVALAVFIGKVRLIDNIFFKEINR